MDIKCSDKLHSDLFVCQNLEKTRSLVQTGNVKVLIRKYAEIEQNEKINEEMDRPNNRNVE
jgi:hypothetical protein